MRLFSPFVIACTLILFSGSSTAVAAEENQTLPIKVKVFVAAQFEIGNNTGDRAGELQHWYEHYWFNSDPIDVTGAESSVFCNDARVCGTALGMGKVRSSSSMTAILLNPKFDFSQAYFLIVGVGGTPPTTGTIAAVFWADWLVDYDLGHRWAAEEGLPGEPVFSPRKGYEQVRVIQLNKQLVVQAVGLTRDLKLKDSSSAKTYRQRYTPASARREPFVGVGTHVAGDTFFHGPGLSAEAQYICELYDTSPYVITEMEGVAVAYVIQKFQSIDRVMSLRVAVNFDQGSATESTLQHLDPEPGNTPGGFDVGLENNFTVGSTWVDHLLKAWPN